ncbi:isochorismatase hydrolase [Methylobacterium sp. 4-46]|uniref:cysteine hydrolase family protein n=1 Tax=unclassified Methylobacterium TaxID=2615210 RepID=UPI000152C490|nr:MULTISPECIES: cysteine hydrolase [Methylobacterium]ACA16864.1 isochorismatase hydrolase [Methylobacterium sp. 4-46]WFT82554.1 cysteine hydrolase [Methylobacterium nodulans]
MATPTPETTDALPNGPLGEDAIHVCVDMQNLFARDTAWHTPWLPRVLPRVRELAARSPERTVFTRFVPARHPGEGRGTWRRYYERWSSMTIDALGEEMVELVPDLAGFAPPARVVDKHVYSPWLEPGLDHALRDLGAETLVITGGETDVCVLATVLGAVDRGYRVVLATDGLCSSCDETHDAMLTLYQQRFGQQLETATIDQILHNWR